MYRIVVIAVSGGQIAIDVDWATRVADVKAKIQERMWISPDVRLSSGGKELEDRK